MKPVAYKIASLLGGYSYCSVPRYDDDEAAGVLRGKEVRGLFLSPQPDCVQGAEVYLFNRDTFLEPFEVAEGVCPSDCLSLYLGPVIQEADNALVSFGLRVRDTVQSMVLRLAKFHWSPNHPSTYTITHPVHGGQVGLGIIAMRDPASFNLAFAEMNGELDTALKQQKAVALFVGYEGVLKEGESDTLYANLTMMTEAEFREWLQDATNCTDIPESTIQHIRKCLKLPDVRKV